MKLLFKSRLSSIIRVITNRIFYIKNKNHINKIFWEEDYKNLKPFNLNKWHHDLFLFSGTSTKGETVFIKLTKLSRILKNENKAYLKFQKNDFLKNHIIEHIGYINKHGFKALILKRAKGIVLNEEWASKNIDKLDTLIKIVDEFSALSLVHRDIKLDNFIYEQGEIRIFDFSFMIDKSKKNKLKEINLSERKNMLKLLDLGINYKPEPLKWDDYYSLYVIFYSIYKNKSIKISLEEKAILFEYIEECKAKIGSNYYTILK